MLINTNNIYENITLSGWSESSLVNRYSIFGNILENIIGENLWTNTGVILDSGIGEKRIITQLWQNDFSYFATHFQKSAILNDYCEIWEQRYPLNTILTWYQEESVACGSECTEISIICKGNGWSDPPSTLYESCEVEACDCTLPRWWTISNGESITAYQSELLECGQRCVSEQRTCNDWTLDWSFEHQSCTIEPCGCEDPSRYDWAESQVRERPHGFVITWFTSSSVACGETCLQDSLTCDDWQRSSDATLFENCDAQPCDCSFEWVDYNDWDTITWYSSSSVACGDSCDLNTITCDDWSWDGNISLVQYQSCTVDDCGCTFDWVDYDDWDYIRWYEYDNVDCWDRCERNTIVCENWSWDWDIDLVRYWDCDEVCRDCRTPWWERIEHWDDVKAFLHDHVDCGKSCLWQTRTCNDWRLDWFFEYEDCEVNECEDEYHGAAGNFCDYYKDAPYLSKWVFQDTLWHRGFNYIENMRLSCLHRGKGTQENQRIYYPDDYIKKSEILKTLVKIMWINFDNFQIKSEDLIYPRIPIFKDISQKDWFVWYSEYAFLNWLTNWLYDIENSQKILHPNDFVKRKDVVKKIIEIYTKIYGDIEIEWNSNLVDISRSDLDYYYIRKAESLWIIKWVQKNDWKYYFQWDEFVTRAQFAKMISIAFEELLFE